MGVLIRGSCGLLLGLRLWMLLLGLLLWMSISQAIAHEHVPPAELGPYYLAEMHGQGEYFDIRDVRFPTRDACIREAEGRNNALSMWRWICVRPLTTGQ